MCFTLWLNLHVERNSEWSKEAENYQKAFDRILTLLSHSSLTNRSIWWNSNALHKEWLRVDSRYRWLSVLAGLINPHELKLANVTLVIKVHHFKSSKW